MQNNASLVERITQDYPGISFQPGEVCYWSAAENTVRYVASDEDEDMFQLFHEIAHAALWHSHYREDIELIRKEVEAWDYAKLIIGPAYGIVIPDDFIDEALDTYRLWLHARSTCPACRHTGLQTKNSTYECMNCRCCWHVNDARQCRLKRRTLIV